jgi:short-chain fatty acids transporter
MKTPWHLRNRVLILRRPRGDSPSQGLTDLRGMRMQDRLDRYIRAIGAFIPDAMSLAVFMLAGLIAIALVSGSTPVETADALYRGLWMLLPFSMQVTLLLVLSGVLAATPLFRQVVLRFADLPRSINQVFLYSALLVAALSYLYWGLAMALGPLIAVHFARAAERRGIRVDFPCLLAAQYAAGSVWQYGLSSTAALLVATPGHFLEASTGVMPLSTTIWSPATLLMVVLFPLLVVVLARWVMPREVEQLSAFPHAWALTEASDQVGQDESSSRGFARWSETSRFVPLLLVALLGVWLWHHFVNKHAGLDLNAMVTLLLAAALLMQGNIANFSKEMREAIKTCWAIVVLYQIYGAVAGVLQFTNIGTTFAEFFAAISSPLSFPLLTAIAGTVVAFFVPSSGGQWVIQGFVTSEAAAAVGTSPQVGLLALGVGDQMGNLTSPFWLIVIAGVARVEFRKIYGFSLLFAALWFVLGVAIFTLVA